MKNKRFLLPLIAALVALLCIGLTACNKGDGGKKYSNVSRQTDAYFTGASDLFAVTVEKGRREKTFIADGVATDVNDFAEIIITPLTANDYESISFELSAEGSTLSGTLTEADYGDYISEITLGFAPTKIVVTAGENVSSEIELSNILEGALSSADIINIAKSEFKERIDNEKSQGKADREIYVKIITGDRTNYYYYVSFIGEGVDYWAMLVNPVDGSIVSKK